MFQLILRESLARELVQRNVPQIKYMFDSMLKECLLTLCWYVKFTKCVCFGNMSDYNFTESRQDFTRLISIHAAYFSRRTFTPISKRPIECYLSIGEKPRTRLILLRRKLLRHQNAFKQRAVLR